MIKNYFTIAWRNLVKNKVYSFINIAGLAIGLSCFLMISLYVVDEMSYDKYNKNAGRIFRINSDIKMGETSMRLTVTSDMMGEVMKRDFPEVEEYARIFNSNGDKLLKKGDEFIYESAVAHVDSTFFSVFTMPVIQGDTRTALNEPNTVVLTEKAALKYFGTTDAIGKTLQVSEDSLVPFKVTAVIADMPVNSHFNFDFLFSMDNVNYGWGNYMSHNFKTYLLLKKGVDAKAFQAKFEPLYIEKYIFPQAKEMMKIANMDEFKKSGNRLHYELMPVTDIHLRSDRFPELGVNGNIQYVYIFGAVALFILLIACVNFMNLSTARSANRAKEVGIRKVLGTGKDSLIRQFLAESIFTVYISMFFGILITWLALPYFNEVSGKTMSVSQLFTPGFSLFLIVLPMVVGLLAGSYPAFFLSSFRPIAVLKGKLSAGSSRSVLRSSLVVFQFATSIMLIIGTLVVYRQLNYIQNTKVGFNKDQLLVIDGTNVLSSPQAFKEEVSRIPGVTSASFTGYLPVSNSSRTDNTFSKEAVLDQKNGLNMQAWRTDYDYIPTMGMEMVKGRNFSRDFGTDSSAIIINETAAAILGYDDPIGKPVYRVRSEGPLRYTIVGVVKNFHFSSLKEKVAPLCLVLGTPSWSTSFRVKTTNLPALVGQVEKKWKEMAPGMPFSYSFLDQSFNAMYRSEQQVGRVAMSFSILAILIACLGLFGLATYMAEQRTKEIGVRKVLGASVNNIVLMLSKDFLRLVLIASLIAFPVAGWAMSRWLRDFASRIDIGWWVFLVAGLSALLIAIITVSFQAIRAAIANPVKSLRTE
jgi:putative ABC transport system permease protein